MDFRFSPASSETWGSMDIRILFLCSVPPHRTTGVLAVGENCVTWLRFPFKSGVGVIFLATGNVGLPSNDLPEAVLSSSRPRITMSAAQPSKAGKAVDPVSINAIQAETIRKEIRYYR
ncbi:MAG: hypothetical protein BJ554DRAFT_5137, partial [Olpidium bornovanus]